MEGFTEFFKTATGFEPYPWQAEVARKILKMDRGVLLITAETGSGKTEATVMPGLYSGRQVIVVEPFRALVEDMVDRLSGYLEKLSMRYGVPYSLAVDYGGDTKLLECINGSCGEVATRKPFGADVYVTTMDELLYRLLSVAIRRKASIYAALVRLGTPLVFFDEVHSYTSDVGNPFITVMHEVLSIALYTPVVVASATLPDIVMNHLKALVNRNELEAEELKIPPRPKPYPKGVVTVDLSKGVDTILKHTLNLLQKHRTVLVRVVVPETAYSVYLSLKNLLLNAGVSANIGVIHGRMPVRDRARVFKAVRKDVRSGNEKVVLVATPAIEAGVDLDFDAGVVELTPYRSLEQTLGRVNRHHIKQSSEIVIVDVADEHWKLLEEGSYLKDVRDVLQQYKDRSPTWEEVRDVLKQLDVKYTNEKLSTANLVDAYTSPYSRLLATSFHSLFHLSGTLLDYVIAVGKEEYETRESLDIVVEVEGELGNYLRIPVGTAKKLDLHDYKIPRNTLKNHDYIKIKEGTQHKIIEADGLITQ